MTITINDIQESALLSDSFYDRLDWQQFLIMAEQAYLKLNDALNRTLTHRKNSGKWIDARADVLKWNDITLKMSNYVRTKVPAWMYDEFNEYIEDVLSEAEKNRR